MFNLRSLKAQGYREHELKAIIDHNKQVLAGKAEIPDVVGQ